MQTTAALGTTTMPLAAAWQRRPLSTAAAWLPRQRRRPQQPQQPQRRPCTRSRRTRAAAVVALLDYAPSAADEGVLALPARAELDADEVRSVFGYPRDLRARYYLGRPIGAGSFGTVREAAEAATGRRFAIKTVPKAPKRGPPTPRYLLKLRAEVDAMRQLGASPDAVALHEVYEDDEAVHLVMELCEGGALMERVAARRARRRRRARRAAADGEGAAAAAAPSTAGAGEDGDGSGGGEVEQLEEDDNNEGVMDIAEERYLAGLVRSILRFVAQCHAKVRWSPPSFAPQPGASCVGCSFCTKHSQRQHAARHAKQHHSPPHRGAASPPSPPPITRASSTATSSPTTSSSCRTTTTRP